MAVTYALSQFSDSAKANLVMNANRIILVTGIVLICIYARVYNYFKWGLEVYCKWRCLNRPEICWAITFAIAICCIVAFIIISWATVPLLAAARQDKIVKLHWISAWFAIFLYAIFEYINYDYPVNLIDFWQSTLRLLTNPIGVICWKVDVNRAAKRVGCLYCA